MLSSFDARLGDISPACSSMYLKTRLSISSFVLGGVDGACEGMRSAELLARMAPTVFPQKWQNDPDARFVAPHA